MSPTSSPIASITNEEIVTAVGKMAARAKGLILQGAADEAVKVGKAAKKLLGDLDAEASKGLDWLIAKGEALAGDAPASTAAPAASAAPAAPAADSTSTSASAAQPGAAQ